MDPFAKRELGSSSLHLEQLSFGSAPLGNAWKLHDDGPAADTLRTAYDTGFRTYDTAPYYGFGLSEYRLAHALREKPRDSYGHL